jgi:hypothetical protein
MKIIQPLKVGCRITAVKQQRSPGGVGMGLLRVVDFLTQGADKKKTQSLFSLNVKISNSCPKGQIIGLLEKTAVSRGRK